MFQPKSIVKFALAVGVAGLLAAPAAAQIKLKMHSFNSPKSPESKWIFDTMNADFKKHSGGTLSLQVYYGMSLGGKARDLIPQVANGVVDMVWTLPAYHAGRFPILTGLELPFIGDSGEQMSQVAWEWLGKYAHREFKDFRVVSLNSIDKGILHTSKRAVRKLEDVKGLKLRVAGRYIGMAVKSLGGVPVQMPLPPVYESLARGQTQGMMIPWLITVPFKLLDVTKYHTEIAVYHTTLLMAMNNNSYNKLSSTQKNAMAKSTGVSFAKHYGKLWDVGAKNGRDTAIKKGNTIIKLDAKEEARWREAAKGAYRAWIDEMNSKGLNGQQMFDELRALAAKYRVKS